MENFLRVKGNNTHETIFEVDFDTTLFSVRKLKHTSYTKYSLPSQTQGRQLSAFHLIDITLSFKDRTSTDPLEISNTLICHKSYQRFATPFASSVVNA